MPSLARRYADEIHNERGYWATWEPNVHLTLGTCGPVVDGVFRPEGELGDFTIDFATSSDPTASDTDYSSREGLRLSFQTRAMTEPAAGLPLGTAGAQIAFTRTQAVVLAAKGAREDRIADQNKLRRQILASAGTPFGIPDGWFVITHLVRCASATVIVALGAGAEIKVSAQADLTGGVADLANASIGLAVQNESNIGYKMLARDGATPLFRGLRLKRHWLRQPRLETLGPAGPDSELEGMFEELSPDVIDRDLASTN